MTINQQLDNTFEHPAFKLAIQRVIEGDFSDLRRVFFEIMFHTYEKSTLNASRNYGKSRWLNTCDILEEIRNTAPPENLDLRLPIPSKRLFTKVKQESPKPKTVTMRKLIIANPNQLTLVFQQTA